MRQKNPNIINELYFTIPSFSVNEGAARAITGAFCAQLNPTFEELADIKCSVSEAVTNSIVHGYKLSPDKIYITVTLYKDRSLRIVIRDKGCGIEDIKTARQPLFTTDKTGERSGMGFTVMESFMDKIRVVSKIDKGTKVTLYKKLEDVSELGGKNE